MEFSLEGILETLLIGSIASLCGVSVLFLFVPSFVRIPFIHSIFKFFFFEDGVGKQHHDSSSQAIKEAARQLQIGETPKLFAGILLCAALYGSGLISESLSDVITNSEFAETQFARRLQFFSDPEIRIDAFDAVGTSAVKSGNVPDEFREFVADYNACRSYRTTKDASLLEDKKYCTTCSSIYARARAFYYTAKNIVYREEPYFRELSRLQSRIDFTRAASQVLAFLAAILSAAFLFGIISEGLWRLREAGPQHLPTWYRRIYSKTPKPVRGLVKHWIHLDATRCIAMGGMTLVLAVAALFSWRDNEDEFDRRVFGYFLSYPAQANNTLWAMPRSTFTRFELDGQSQFEPSAIEALGDGEFVIIANDKGGAEPFSIFGFKRGESGRDVGMEVASGNLEQQAVFGLPDHPIAKVESLHVIAPQGGDKTFEVWACGTFWGSDPNNHRLVSFTIPRNLATSLAGNEAKVTADNPTEWRVVGLPEFLDEKPGEVVVEGMTMTADRKHLILGVRFRGKPRVPGLAIVYLELVNAEWVPKSKWVHELSGEFKNSGISSLGVHPADGSLLVLTSIEDELKPNLANQVRGALWRVPASDMFAPNRENWSIDRTGDSSNARSYLVGIFPHKPEGVTVLDNDSIVVVFDDDSSRKSREYVPDTFALSQNQSVFTVIRPLPNSSSR